jgi:hypothetical protein
MAIARSTRVETVRLHPMIRAEVGIVDLRRIRILSVVDGLAVDLIVENQPRPWLRLPLASPLSRAA